MKNLDIALAEEILSEATKTIEDAKALARLAVRLGQNQTGPAEVAKQPLRRKSPGEIKAADAKIVTKAFANVPPIGYNPAQLYDIIHQSGDPIPNDREKGEKMISRRLSKDRYRLLDNGNWMPRRLPVLVKNTG